jgi:hypothetical protein
LLSQGENLPGGGIVPVVGVVFTSV